MVQFYEPQVIDAPADVDWKGIQNTLAGALKYGDLPNKKLFSCQPGFLDRWSVFAPLDDIVMGGVSDSSITLESGVGEEQEAAGTSKIAAVFTGVVSTE